MDGIALGLFLVCSVHGWIRIRPGRFCHGVRRVRHMAAHHHADPDHDADRRVRPLDAGLRRLEARHTLDWRTVAPFIIGGMIGVPLGTMLLTYINPAYLRLGVGVLLVIYSVYGLAQPGFKPGRVGAAADGGIGFLNGVLGGLTGLPGFIITVWCQMRGWTKDEQRAVFQPVILTGMMMIAISLGVAGAITIDTLKLYPLGLPALLAGLWLGFKCYGKLDDATFRKLVLVLLLCSGLALIAAQRWPFTRLSPSSVVSTLISPAVAGPVCRPALSLTHDSLVGDATAKQRAAMDRRRGGRCIEIPRPRPAISRSDSCARKKMVCR